MRDGCWSWTGTATGRLSLRSREAVLRRGKDDLHGALQTRAGQSLLGRDQRRAVSRSFVSASNVPAPCYIILFATQSADGKPTPIPADLLEQAKAINARAGSLPNNAQKAAEQSVKAATPAVEQWLAALDAGKYADCWERSAAGDAEGGGEGGLGGNVERGYSSRSARLSHGRLLSTNYTTSLPGAPDGEYVIMQYQTRFREQEGRCRDDHPDEGSRRPVARVGVLRQVEWSR